MMVATRIVLELGGPSTSLPGTPNTLRPRVSGCTDDGPIAPRQPHSVGADCRSSLSEASTPFLRLDARKCGRSSLVSMRVHI